MIVASSALVIGLGLAVTHKIITDHQGTIDAKSPKQPGVPSR
jgi:nitrogen-specific signal transduction histidine kinase